MKFLITVFTVGFRQLLFVLLLFLIPLVAYSFNYPRVMFEWFIFIYDMGWIPLTLFFYGAVFLIIFNLIPFTIFFLFRRFKKIDKKTIELPFWKKELRVIGVMTAEIIILFSVISFFMQRLPLFSIPFYNVPFHVLFQFGYSGDSLELRDYLVAYDLLLLANFVVIFLSMIFAKFRKTVSSIKFKEA